MKNTIQVLRKFTLLVLGALILCCIAFYNNFPLLFPDSGSYIRSGFESWVAPDRPILYGLFIRHLSLAYSLWLVIFFQSLVVSFVIYSFMQRVLRPNHLAPLFIGILVILVLVTGLAIHSGQVLPDIFTALAFLCLILLLIPSEGNSLLEQGSLILIYEFSLCVHNSNILVNLIVIGLVTLNLLWKKYIRKTLPLLKISYQRLLLVWTIALAPFLLVPSLSVWYNGPFKITSSSHIFMMNHLNECGILGKYLDENCEKKHYRICQYKGAIPTDFIWDMNSPLYKTGGWDANKGEYDSIVHDILTSSPYLKMFCTKSVEYTFKQFFSFDFTGVAPPCLTNSSPYFSLHKALPDEARESLLALQQMERLNFQMLGMVQLIVVFLSALGLYLLFYTGRISPVLRFSVLLIIAVLLANAFVCGNFSTVSPRYQSRVVWLIPFLFLLALAPKADRWLQSKIKPEN
jgi:hypothetical protein